MLPRHIWVKTQNNMWKNYLLTSYRAFKRDRFYITINVFSLGIAFALCIIGYFNYEFNNSFNAYFKDADHIYKINAVRYGVTENQMMGISPAAIKSVLKEIPESTSARLHRNNLTIKIGDALYQENISFVDPEFLEIFEFQFVNGIKFTATNSAEIIIDDQTAEKLFGNNSAIGKIITIMLPNHQETPFVVSGVIKKPPRNTSFFFNMLIPFGHYEKLHQIQDNSWEQWVHGTFIKSKKSPKAIETLLNNYLNIQNEKNKDLKVSSYSVCDILEWPKIENSLYQGRFMGHLHPASVMGTISSAITILLLACFNYINTSIAISGKRLKEIGIRKIVGGKRKSIITQFMVENTVLVLIAMLISIGVCQAIIPYYNAMFDITLVSPDIVDLNNLVIIGLVVFGLVALSSGAYPAFYISKFHSLHILKDKIKFSGNNWLFKGLLTFQFIACFYNIFSLLVFVENAAFQKTLDRGYKITNTVNVPLNTPSQFRMLYDQLAMEPAVNSIAGTKDLVGFHTIDATTSFRSKIIQSALIDTGKDYLKNIGVRLQKGQFFERTFDHDQPPILINDMLNQSLGGSLLDEILSVNDQRYKVIGIVDDFNLKPIMLDNKIRPTIIRLVPEEKFQYVTVTSTTLTEEELNAVIETRWYGLFPNELYRGFGQDKVLHSLAQTNNIILNINSFIAIVALLITILGLYTLISLTVQRRIKEFGIRKVLGASPAQILKLINSQLFWILFISAIVGLVIGYQVITRLLDTIYAYHMEIGISHIITPIGIMLLVVIVSVAQKSISTAKLNPTTQLRME